MDLTVFVARSIRTMNASMPQATAVAVADGRIVEVGSLESLKPWLDAHPHRTDRTFENHVLMPGFIDPHLHPTLGAILMPCHFITAMEWVLPDRTCPAVTSHAAYLARLEEIEAGMADADEVLITWGFHRIWHGNVDREALNRVSGTRPIFVWQRSFHEIIANDAAIDWMGIDRADLERHPQIDLASGRFYETGLAVAMKAVNRIVLEPTRFAQGLELVKRTVHLGGHTTIGELAYPLADDAREWDVLVNSLERDDVPFRMKLIPRAALRGTWGGDVSQDLARVEAYATRGTHRLFFGNAVKLFADGGFFAELMQMRDPGFIDGHHGEWLTEPANFEALARAFWLQGKQLHVHCTGDMGVELALDVLEKLQAEKPRFNHRFTIEHFGVSNPEQVRRMTDLGAIVSANVYYVHELGEAYWINSIGYERASQMARLGTLEREGVTFAVHSDFTMAPAMPLNSAWVAVNRIAESGAVLCAEERTSVEAAMRAITIDAAYVLGLEDSIGSIRAGKKADFTVLEADPFEVAPESLKDIPIWGTVFEGTPFPITP
ncbi:amidohydrolase [Thalassobaculum sp. OXR-137]|uniref:amidohydrolase n=1 Tax=Thalassobaculum sp. OXR-137 TaxID=3100173 RepID=UPI002AC95654|nr:amidohydrolase [Thalassobaculum sp. OXR-137]WPZ32707.1 amidohydrolase [Thalassobaculum sp. OXR-137]